MVTDMRSYTDIRQKNSAISWKRLKRKSYNVYHLLRMWCRFMQTTITNYLYIVEYSNIILVAVIDIIRVCLSVKTVADDNVFCVW